MRRCTLMAVICNHAGLQKHLPQALLPRDRAKKEPAAKMKRLYSSMGAPSEAWHGTGGHTDTHTHDEAVVETCCTSCEAAHGRHADHLGHGYTSCPHWRAHPPLHNVSRTACGRGTRQAHLVSATFGREGLQANALGLKRDQCVR